MLNNLKITARLLIGFGVLVLMMAAFSAATLFSGQSIEDAFETMRHSQTNQMLDDKLVKHLYIARMNIYAGLATGEEVRWTRAHEALSVASQTQAQLLGQVQEPARKAMVVQLGNLITEYNKSAFKLQQFKTTNTSLESPEAQAILSEAGKAAIDIDQTGQSLQEALEASNTSRAEETTAAITRLIDIAMIVGGLSLALGILLSVSISRSIIAPLGLIVGNVQRLGRGEIDQPVPGSHRHDEFGPLAAAIEQWRQSLLAAEERKRQDQADLAAREARQARVMEATSRFEGMIVSLLERIKQAAEHLHHASDNLSANAEQTKRQSNAVSEATEIASANVHSVSAAGSQLTAAINEISAQVQRSAAIARSAQLEAEESTRKVAGLQESAQKIGEVVNLINDIAAQTNLLALNATIEAARAGEAGKGFAVVANEVKHLANQTGRATEDIATQVASVQAQTQEAVEAIDRIGETIVSLNEMATIIAGAVEEQGAAASDIARNVQEASNGTQEVSRNIQGVAHAAGETTHMAEGVFSSANSLLEESATLEKAVHGFLDEMRRA
ncbi:MAG TPA: methyl-accepting chemotaxis protein [Candidatus Sulfotelmatobacter sp.]|jgi:methyl-accepting chemotaxis protein|nr:methyl-accepting chemotaxis protein [Candidatus Sulfotelmatobacter sp.]